MASTGPSTNTTITDNNHDSSQAQRAAHPRHAADRLVPTTTAETTAAAAAAQERYMERMQRQQTLFWQAAQPTLPPPQCPPRSQPHVQACYYGCGPHEHHQPQTEQQQEQNQHQQHNVAPTADWQADLAEDRWEGSWFSGSPVPASRTLARGAGVASAEDRRVAGVEEIWRWMRGVEEGRLREQERERGQAAARGRCGGA